MRRNAKKRVRLPLEPIEVRYPDGTTRGIGTYDPNRNEFKKWVHESTHLFRKLDAWGIDAEIFTERMKGKKMRIVVEDRETRITYLASPMRFEKFGKFFHFKSGATERSHRSQIFLPRCYWDRAGDPAALEKHKPRPPEPEERDPLADEFPEDGQFEESAL